MDKDKKTDEPAAPAPPAPARRGRSADPRPQILSASPTFVGGAKRITVTLTCTAEQAQSLFSGCEVSDTVRDQVAAELAPTEG